MIRHHQKMEKEAFILDSLCRLRAQLDEGTEKGGVMTSMVKDLADLEEATIRREAMRTTLGPRAAVVGRGDAGMSKGGESATEVAAQEFEAHASCVYFLEIEVAVVQAEIDVQESAGVSNHNVEPPCHTSDQ